MTNSNDQLWEGIDLKEMVVKHYETNKDEIIFSKIQFDFPISRYQKERKIIRTPFVMKEIQDIMQKTEIKEFTFSDYEVLKDIINEFVINIKHLFMTLKNKNINSNDAILQKIMKTVHGNFSTLGLFFFRKGYYYFDVSKMIYHYYYQCLFDIEYQININIGKGVPRFMIGLIYANTEHYMWVLPQLGMTLTEDRKANYRGTADKLYRNMYAEEYFFLNEVYEEVKNDFGRYQKMISNLPESIVKLNIRLKEEYPNFPEHVLLFCAQKHRSMRIFNLDFDPYEDIFTCIMRIELLMVLTAFVETILKKILNSNDSLHSLINDFNDKAFNFKLGQLSNVEQYIPSYTASLGKYIKNSKEYYSAFYDYILNLETDEPTTPDIDISSIEGLKVFKSSIILWILRNQIHHNLDISSVVDSISIRENVPQVFNFLSDIKKFNQIYKFIRYYICLILIYAYNQM